MNMETRNSLSTANSEVPRRPVRSFRFLRWLNGSVHWISAIVLLYAFISNGETTHAMMDSAAMRREVKLGLVVGLIFLLRFVWVQSRRSSGGRWLVSTVRMPQSKIRQITDWGIYLGVAASVVSGLLIAYLRPGAAIISEGGREFTTSNPALNFALEGHAFISVALEWLCGFHATYSLWYWLIRKTQWGNTAGVWIERVVSAASRMAASSQRKKPSSIGPEPLQ
jgi:cytochrome b561